METSNVLTDKWEFKGISIIKTPYQEFRIKPFAKDGKDMGKLIVTAVNACKAINQNNPINAAAHLVELIEMYKQLQQKLEMLINATETGEIRAQLTGLNILALLKLQQATE